MTRPTYEGLRDALDHIHRVAGGTSPHRLQRWIAMRARCALEGSNDWQTADLPKVNGGASLEEGEIKRLQVNLSCHKKMMRESADALIEAIDEDAPPNVALLKVIDRLREWGRE